LVEEPQALWAKDSGIRRRRLRDQRRSAVSCRPGGRAPRAKRLDVPGQPRTVGLEQAAQRQVDLEGLAQARDNA
jgi:hypothetical protein